MPPHPSLTQVNHDYRALVRGAGSCLKKWQAREGQWARRCPSAFIRLPPPSTGQRTLSCRDHCAGEAQTRQSLSPAHTCPSPALGFSGGTGTSASASSPGAALSESCVSASACAWGGEQRRDYFRIYLRAGGNHCSSFQGKPLFQRKRRWRLPRRRRGERRRRRSSSSHSTRQVRREDAVASAPAPSRLVPPADWCKRRGLQRGWEEKLGVGDRLLAFPEKRRLFWVQWDALAQK